MLMSMIEIIHQAVDANPSSSKEEVSYAIVDYIEAMLPSIVRMVKSPVIPSPVEMRLRQFRFRRMPKRAKIQAKELTGEQELFYREIAWLRNKLDGGSWPNHMGFALQGDQDYSVAPTTITSRDFIFPSSLEMDGTPTSNLIPKLSKLPHRIRSLSPYVSSIIEAKEPLLPRFILAQEVMDRVGSDSMFAQFFRIVESTVRKFAHVHDLTWEFEASTPTDVEIPSWKPIVLRIKPLNTEFEKWMDLWDQIDKEVRKAINVASITTHPSESEKIKELNKNFFIEMDFD